MNSISVKLLQIENEQEQIISSFDAIAIFVIDVHENDLVPIIRSFELVSNWMPSISVQFWNEYDSIISIDLGIKTLPLKSHEQNKIESKSSFSPVDLSTMILPS